MGDALKLHPLGPTKDTQLYIRISYARRVTHALSYSRVVAIRLPASPPYEYSPLYPWSASFYHIMSGIEAATHVMGDGRHPESMVERGVTLLTTRFGADKHSRVVRSFPNLILLLPLNKPPAQHLPDRAAGSE